jgi:predicted phage tail protein
MIKSEKNSSGVSISFSGFKKDLLKEFEAIYKAFEHKFGFDFTLTLISLVARKDEPITAIEIDVEGIRRQMEEEAND